MALVVGTDAYFGVTEANDIVDNEFMSQSEEAVYWNSLTNDKDKEVLIKRATTLLDNLVYLGYKIDTDKKLNWPRNIGGKQVEFPYELKIAVLLQGINSNKDVNKDESKLQSLGVKKYSTAEASIEFTSGADNNLMMYGGIYKDVYDTYIKHWLY